MFKFNAYICILLLPILTHAKSLNSYVIGCPQDGKVNKVKITSKILINQTFLDKDDSKNAEHLRKQAIEFQLKHLLGFYRTTKSNGLNVSMSSYRHEFKILKTEKSDYGIALKIDDYMAPERSFQSENMNSYTKQALSRGETKATDPAELIEYETELILADCSLGPFLKAVKVALPLDPFLSFWIDDPKNRTERMFNGNKRKLVSGCLSQEIIEFGSADQNWFFWSPIENKKNTQGADQSCKFLNARATVEPQLTISDSISNTDFVKKDFFSNSKTAQFYGIFGKISENNFFIKSNLLEYRNLVQNNFQKCSDTKDTPKCLKIWNDSLAPNADKKRYEPGFFFYAQFLRDLNLLMIVKTWSISNLTSDRDIVVAVSGTLLNSEKPIDIKAYFGTTSLDHGPSPTKAYIDFLHKAFSEADLISYLGHSGLGSNVSVNNYLNLWKAGGLKPVKREKPLWFGIYNCEGYSYYGFDQLQLFKENKQKLLLTMSTGVEAEAKFPLAQIFIFDKLYSSSEGVSIKEMFGRYVQSRDFYVGSLLQ